MKPLSVNRASGNLWPVCNPLTDEHPDQTQGERERNCRMGLESKNLKMVAIMSKQFSLRY